MVEEKHSRASPHEFLHWRIFTSSKISASVYTQEKFTLKFYLTNVIIKDKKIDVNFVLERILEKENAALPKFSSCETL